MIDTVISTNYFYLRHMTVHEETKKFKCPNCPFTTRISHHLKRHSRLHTGSKPYQCPHCTYSCNSLVSLGSVTIPINSRHRLSITLIRNLYFPGEFEKTRTIDEQASRKIHLRMQILWRRPLPDQLFQGIQGTFTHFAS